MSNRLAVLLRSPRLPWWLAGLSLLLTSPALFVGWQVDDWYHQALIRGVTLPGEAPLPWTGMFDFLGGDPGRATLLRDFGFAPWWLPDAFHARFLRPITVATHLLDDALMRGSAVLAHAHSLLWSAAVVAVATLLYRRVLGLTAAAGLAALLYAIDESRGIPTGWIANRSALVALVLGMTTLLAHIRWRQDGWTPGAWLAPVLLAVTLLAAESGLATTAYLFAFAVHMDRGPLARRLVRLWPYALVVVLWRLAYDAGGFGASGSGLYLDPVAQPDRFLAAAAVRLPVLLAAQWTSLPSVVSNFVPDVVSVAIVSLSLLLLVGMAALLRPLWRDSAEARMWTTAMTLSAIPVCATFPANRLLGFVGIGGAGLLAMLVSHYRVPRLSDPGADTAPADTAPADTGRRPRLAVLLLLVPSLLLSGPSLAYGSRTIADMAGLLFHPCERAVPTADIADKTVVFVNSNALCVGYVPIQRIVQGRPAPGRVRLLSSAIYDVEVTGVDAHRLRVRVADGFHSHPADQLMRSGDDPMPIGQRVKLAGMEVTALSHTPAGHLREIEVRFDVPLTDPSLLWIATRDLEPSPFTPPAPGRTVVLPAAF